MKRTSIAISIVLAAIIVAAGVAIVTGQRSASAPAAYTAPRTPEGHPDFEGVWQALNSAAWDVQAHPASWDVPPGVGVVEGNEIPYQPWALAQKKTNFENRATADPDRKCYYPGVPRIMYLPHPFQIVQNKDVFEMVFEYGHYTRLIYLHGYPHHDEIPFWMGDSRGKWEGDTLVVDSRNFFGQTWFDKAGNFHSDAMRLIERLTRVDDSHLQYEVTVEDPKVFTRPWKMSMPLYRRVEPNIMPLEYECMALDVYEKGRFNSRIDEANRKLQNK